MRLQKKGIAFTLVLLFAISTAMALTSNVQIISKANSFTGAVLKVQNPATGEIGDPIYPSERFMEVGIVNFEVETSLPESELLVILINNGVIVKNEAVGPYEMGGDLTIDFRSGEAKLVEEEEVEPSAPTETNETTQENNTQEAEKNKTVVEVEETTATEVEEISENSSEAQGDTWLTGFITQIKQITGKVTGLVIGDEEIDSEGGRNSLYIILISFLVGGAIMYFIVRRAYKSGAEYEKKQFGKAELDRKIDELDSKDN